MPKTIIKRCFKAAKHVGDIGATLGYGGLTVVFSLITAGLIVVASPLAMALLRPYRHTVLFEIAFPYVVVATGSIAATIYFSSKTLHNAKRVIGQKDHCHSLSDADQVFVQVFGFGLKKKKKVAQLIMSDNRDISVNEISDQNISLSSFNVSNSQINIRKILEKASSELFLCDSYVKEDRKSYSEQIVGLDLTSEREIFSAESQSKNEAMIDEQESGFIKTLRL